MTRAYQEIPHLIMDILNWINVIKEREGEEKAWELVDQLQSHLEKIFDCLKKKYDLKSGCSFELPSLGANAELGDEGEQGLRELENWLIAAGYYKYPAANKPGVT